MMNVLALDTASPAPAVSLLAGGDLFEESLSADRRASEELLPAVARVLALARRRLVDCGRVAVCAGPGSFTGLRVGLATAWGFGRALGISVEAVSTLEAMAEASRPSGAATVVAALDAGRGELIWQRFALDSPRARLLGAVVRGPRAELSRSTCGEPVVAFEPEIAFETRFRPSGSVAAALSLAVARAPGIDARAGLRGIYSRPSAAEEKRGAP